MVWRDNVFGVGFGVWDEEKEVGGTYTIVESTDSVIMIVANNKVLSIVHICVVISLDSGSDTPH